LRLAIHTDNTPITCLFNRFQLEGEYIYLTKKKHDLYQLQLNQNLQICQVSNRGVTCLAEK